ncbi:MAG: alpha-L-fucosidase, partial [Bryobacterales bacterium]|nr:alpha-L-fucosidase [Bryobacterales bacterium]
HHDGFCLWPTRTTSHNVTRSPWRAGKGDVVRELSQAAQRAGLGFGVYLSPWDRNHPSYGRPEYVEVYRAQLTELLTQYGPIFEVWHDGANGGDGFYGGAREKRTIDKRTYYQWQTTWDLVRRLQPDACIFSDVGPDIRWVGNEKGIAGETCWATYDPKADDGGPAVPGLSHYQDADTGHRGGTRWLPAECDVSIRPGWFWHEKENARVKTPEQLMDLYFRSVGRGANFLLNIPPDRRGRIHEADAASLGAFGRNLREMFARNLVVGKVKASRGGREWNARISGPARVIRLREEIALGQRVDSFAVDAWRNGAWAEVASGSSIGACRLLRLPAPVDTPRLRLRITQSPAEPAISAFEAFA